jgi:hypothetical protein
MYGKLVLKPNRRHPFKNKPPGTACYPGAGLVLRQQTVH